MKVIILLASLSALIAFSEEFPASEPKTIRKEPEESNDDGPIHEDISSHTTENHILSQDAHGIHTTTADPLGPLEESNFGHNAIPPFVDPDLVNPKTFGVIFTEEEPGVNEEYLADQPFREGGQGAHFPEESTEDNIPVREEIFSHTTEKHLLGHDGHGIRTTTAPRPFEHLQFLHLRPPGGIRTTTVPPREQFPGLEKESIFLPEADRVSEEANEDKVPVREDILSHTTEKNLPGPAEESLFSAHTIIPPIVDPEFVNPHGIKIQKEP